MSEYVVKVPDVGEGVAEAELVEWHVAVGDTVGVDQPLVEVLTDKATVEIPAPVGGTITWLAGDAGDVVAVGSPLVHIERDGDAASQPAVPREAAPASQPAPEDGGEAEPESAPEEPPREQAAAPEPETGPPLAPAPPEPPDAPRPHHDVRTRATAAPAVRLRAKEAGVDLRRVAGSGPAGRVTHADLDRYLADTSTGAVPARRGFAAASDEVTETRIIGLRRKIAERLEEAARRIPHIAYVDEVDLTLLQQLRDSLNADGSRARLTLLPFLMRAIVGAVAEFPQFNAHFDDDAGVLRSFRAVHVGIATQTPNGLVVPVVRHAEALDVFAAAEEVERLSSAARDGKATAEELSGSTITITSLGALGGLVTTPIINRPEVAIIGVNKLQVRPVWDGHSFAPRTMMNLSSSFDHRIIDGFDAANFVQRIRLQLESPGRLLLGDG